MSWQSGTQIVQFEMWGEGVATARPVTVVRDTASYIALYSHPSTRIVTRGLENRGTLELRERIDLYMAALDPRIREFRDVVSSEKNVLTITRPDSWHSIWLFWSSEWEFENFYVNFQSPLRRLRHGVAYHDFVLDIVAQPDMSWSWKDMDEFNELSARGFFTDDQKTRIRDEADKMAATIDSQGAPFSDGWENWRPDFAWPTPRLPNNWSDIV